VSEEAKVVWDYLKGNLDNQISAYSRLIDLLSQENKSLIERNHQTLLEVSSQKELLAPEIKDLQKEMSSLMRKILVSSESKNITLQHIIEISPEKYKVMYNKDKKSLTLQKKEIMMLRYRNQKLMENALKYIQHMMNKVMDICSDNQQIYCQRGSSSVLGDSRNWMDIVA